MSSDSLELPLLPLRDVVVYPSMVLPLFVGREKSIDALEYAMQHGKQVLLVAQRDSNKDDPSEGDLFTVGTVASILQLLKLPDGTIKVLVEGDFRAALSEVAETDDYTMATCREILCEEPAESEAQGLNKSTSELFEKYVNTSKK